MTFNIARLSLTGNPLYSRHIAHLATIRREFLLLFLKALKTRWLHQLWVDTLSMFLTQTSWIWFTCRVTLTKRLLQF